MPLPSTGYATAAPDNPASALTDFTLLIDLSTLPASWWAAVDTTDGTRGRAYVDSSEVELAVDWIDFDDSGETGWLRVLWTGTLATTGTQTVRIYPPNTGNAAVAASDTYGSDNAYASHWKMYVPDGGGVDRTSSSNDLTANGGYTAGGSVGKVGTATTFDGTDDYGERADNATLDITGALTIMAWVKSAASAADTEGIISKYFQTGNQRSYVLVQNSTTNLPSFVISSDGTFQSGNVLNGTTALGVGDWHHVAGVFVPSISREIYVDGVSENSSGTAPSGIHSGSAPLWIGMQFSNAAQYRINAVIDDVQIHAAGLPAAWIAEETAQSNDQSTFWTTWTWNAGGGTPTRRRLMLSAM